MIKLNRQAHLASIMNCNGEIHDVSVSKNLVNFLPMQDLSHLFISQESLLLSEPEDSNVFKTITLCIHEQTTLVNKTFLKSITT